MFDGTARPSQVIQRRRDQGPCFLRASRCSLQVLRQRIIRGRKKSRQQYGGHDLKNIVCVCIYIYIYTTHILKSSNLGLPDMCRGQKIVYGMVIHPIVGSLTMYESFMAGDWEIFTQVT